MIDSPTVAVRSTLDGADEAAVQEVASIVNGPSENEPGRGRPDDPEDVPETPPDEPKPVPIQDPPADPDTSPYVTW